MNDLEITPVARKDGPSWKTVTITAFLLAFLAFLICVVLPFVCRHLNMAPPLQPQSEIAPSWAIGLKEEVETLRHERALAKAAVQPSTGEMVVTNKGASVSIQKMPTNSAPIVIIGSPKNSVIGGSGNIINVFPSEDWSADIEPTRTVTLQQTNVTAEGFCHQSEHIESGQYLRILPQAGCDTYAPWPVPGSIDVIVDGHPYYPAPHSPDIIIRSSCIVRIHPKMSGQGRLQIVGRCPRMHRWQP